MTKYVKVAVTTQYNIMRGVKPYRDIDVELSWVELRRYKRAFSCRRRWIYTCLKKADPYD